MSEALLPAEIDVRTSSGTKYVPAASSVQQLMQTALDKGASVESVDALASVFERLVDREATRALYDAIARFQDDCPPVRKRGQAQIVAKSGASYSFRYAELDDIQIVTRPWLRRHGLSYTWDSRTEDRQIVVDCIVRHELGASVTATFSAPVDSPSKSSEAQKAGAALTYAKRQSLVQVLGLTVTDQDLDGMDYDPGDTVSEEQLDELRALLLRKAVDEARFLKFLGVGDLTELPAVSFGVARRALQAKRDRS